MFDIFYFGSQSPGIYPTFERFASSLDEARKLARTKYFWYLNGDADYSQFDFNWVPQWSELQHTHIFPSQWQRNSGTMFVPTRCSSNNEETIRNYSNKESNKVISKPTTKNWNIPETVDINSFDLSWHPDFDDPEPYTYHFPTKWQNTSGLTYTVPGAHGIKFATLMAKIGEPASIHFIQHYNAESNLQLELIKTSSNKVKVDRFVDNYFDTLKRVVSNATTEFIWVINSICDYSEFDFNWTPDVWQQSLMHVFPTGNQKFGDTFYIHVPTFMSQINRIPKLEDYSTIHYCNDQQVNRFNLLTDVVKYNSDTIVDAIKSHSFTKQYALFYPTKTKTVPEFNIPLWLKTKRQVHVLASNGSIAVVPSESKDEIQDQVYDYMHILPHKELYAVENPLDIVYVSNGEPDAERWYNHLLSLNLPNKIHRVKDINGRIKSFHAAADVSSTTWYFAVWGKLEVNPHFNWKWQPDYLQQPKHYIFNAINPVNALEYGHMAMVAYNKRLVLETINPGLDFTLSQEHESVNLNSGIAHFNVSPIITWRTAFREVIKLMNATDDESVARLHAWTNIGNGDNAKWSIAGANDAIEYYKLVTGDMDKLMLSFEWAWTDEYFNQKYH